MDSDTEVLFDFQSLPVVVKLSIFSYFTVPFLATTAARVCKDWWELSKHPSLWKNVVIVCNRVSFSEQYRTILSRCSTLRKLTLMRAFETARYGSFPVPEISNPTLRELKMFCALVNKDFWLNLNTKFLCLETLHFENYTHYLQQQSIDFLYEISALSELKSLTIKMNYSCEDRGDCSLKSIFRAFTRLETLHLGWRVCDSCFRDIICHLKSSLKSVILSGFFATDEQVSFLPVCSKLTSIDIRNCNNITESSLNALETLDLEILQLHRQTSFPDNPLISSDTLCRFFRSPHRLALRELLFVNFRNVSDEVLKCIDQSSRNLTELIIRNSDHVTDEGLARCVNNLPKLSGLYFCECRLISKNILPKLPKTITVEYDLVN